jgi:hypothetical protein
MKYFYSHYPLNPIDGPETFFTLLCIKLSSTILRKKVGREVGIYTTFEFIELLKKYDVELDFYIDIESEIKDISNKKLFATCKIYSNLIQTEPFIQIDTDMILFEDFDFEKYEKSSVLFYFPESVGFLATHREYSSWKELYMNFYNLISKEYPAMTNEEYMNPLVAYNCAMVGGTDWEIFSKIYKPIFDFIVKNKNFIENNSTYPMPEIEQQLIVGFLNKNGYTYDKIEFINSGPIFTLEFLKNEYLNVNYNYGKSLKVEYQPEYDSYASPNLLKLKNETFFGNLHLTGAGRTTLGIRNLIYQKLRYYDSGFINRLESKFGIMYDFQKNLYNNLI